MSRLTETAVLIGPDGDQQVGISNAGKILTMPTGIVMPSPTISGVMTGATFAAGTLVNVGGASSPLTAPLFGTVQQARGLQPSATAAAKIAARVIFPAGSLTAGRGFDVYAFQITANTNSCTMGINLGGTGAIGATVTGGTNLTSLASTAAEVQSHYATVIFGADSGKVDWVASSQRAAVQSALAGAIGAAFDTTAAIQLNLLLTYATATTDGTAFWFVEWGN